MEAVAENEARWSAGSCVARCRLLWLVSAGSSFTAHCLLADCAKKSVMLRRTDGRGMLMGELDVEREEADSGEEKVGRAEAERTGALRSWMGSSSSSSDVKSTTSTIRRSSGAASTAADVTEAADDGCTGSAVLDEGTAMWRECEARAASESSGAHSSSTSRVGMSSNSSVNCCRLFSTSACSSSCSSIAASFTSSTSSLSDVYVAADEWRRDGGLSVAERGCEHIHTSSLDWSASSSKSAAAASDGGELSGEDAAAVGLSVASSFRRCASRVGETGAGAIKSVMWQHRYEGSWWHLRAL